MPKAAEETLSLLFQANFCSAVSTTRSLQSRLRFLSNELPFSDTKYEQSPEKVSCPGKAGSGTPAIRAHVNCCLKPGLISL